MVPAASRSDLVQEGATPSNATLSLDYSNADCEPSLLYPLSLFSSFQRKCTIVFTFSLLLPLEWRRNSPLPFLGLAGSHLN